VDVGSSLPDHSRPGRARRRPTRMDLPTERTVRRSINQIEQEKLRFKGHVIGESNPSTVFKISKKMSNFPANTGNIKSN
jgi:hypothetical protein